MISKTHESRRRRQLALLLGVLSACSARAISVLCSLLQVPPLLALLGPEGFGLWATLHAGIGLAGMLDGGVGYRLQHVAAIQAAAGRPGALRNDLRTVVPLIAGIALAGALLGALPGAGVWIALLGVTDPALGSALTSTLPVLLALSATAILAQLGPRLAAGLQQQWLVGASQAATSMLTLAAVLAAAVAELAPTVVIGLTLALPLLVNSTILLALWAKLPAAPAAAPAGAGRYLRDSLPFFVPQLCAALRTTVPPMLLANFFGAAAVTPYTLLTRLLNLLAQPQQWMLDPLWPAYTDAASRGDYTWVRRALALSFLVSLGLALLPTLSALIWAPAFVTWWTGLPPNTLPTGLLLWLVICQAALVLTTPLTLCLNGLGRLDRQAFYGTFALAFGLGGMVLVCRAGNAPLALAPLALAFAVINLPCAAVDLLGVLRSLNFTATKVRAATAA